MTDNQNAEPFVGKTDAAKKPRSGRTIRTGYVVSDKMDKTIVVEIESRKQHSLYGKIMRRSKKYKAHDEKGLAGVGDRVRIIQTRPLSKDKDHELYEIIEKAK